MKRILVFLALVVGFFGLMVGMSIYPRQTALVALGLMGLLLVYAFWLLADAIAGE